MYFIASGGYYWGLMTGGDVSLKAHASDLLGTLYSALSNLPGASNAAVAILWGIAGIALYVFILLIANFFINARNSKTINQHLTNKPKLLALALLVQYRRIIWIAILSAVLILTTTTLLPLWFQYFDHFNHQHSNVQYLLFGLLGFAYTAYLLSSSTTAVIQNPKISS